MVAPRVELATRSKEGDLTIGPMSQVHLNCAPTCVMEVGVSHEDEAELELEGDEWMQRAEVQVHMGAREPHHMVHGGPAEPDFLGVQEAGVHHDFCQLQLSHVQVLIRHQRLDHALAAGEG